MRVGSNDFSAGQPTLIPVPVYALFTQAVAIHVILEPRLPLTFHAFTSSGQRKPGEKANMHATTTDDSLATD